MIEPIYIVNNIQKKNIYNIKKYFELSDLNDIIPELKNMFFVIKNVLLNKCKPIKNDIIENDIQFVENIYLIELLKILEEINSDVTFSKNDYQFEKQIVNKHFQVIGVSLKNNLFIPCKPSSVILEKPYTFLYENYKTLSYNETKKIKENI